MATHTKKGDVLLHRLASETSKDPVLKRDIEQHTKAPAGPPMPNELPFVEFLGPFGGVAAMLYAAYKRNNENKMRNLVKDIAKKDRAESMEAVVMSGVRV